MQTKLALATLALGLAFCWAPTSQAGRIDSDPGLKLDAGLAELNLRQSTNRIDHQIVRHYRSRQGQYGRYGGRYRTWSHYSPGYGVGYRYGYGNNCYPAPRYRAYHPVQRPYYHDHYPTHVHGGLGIHGPNGSIHIRF